VNYEEMLVTESDIQAHLPTLAQLAYESESIIELGVRTGYSTTAFLHGLAHRGHGHLWSVDIEPPLMAPNENLQWAFIQGDDCSPAVLDRLPTGVDLVFIDTDHAYDHTLAELEAYVPRVRAGGRVLLHDTENEDPSMRGEHIGMQPPFPVKCAIEDYCEEHDLSWSNDPRCWGLGTIRVT
jgi:predicted O-methyltransferase YrrM